jgi:hypothetical protein
MPQFPKFPREGIAFRRKGTKMTKHLTDSPDLTVVGLAGRWAITFACRRRRKERIIDLFSKIYIYIYIFCFVVD